MTLKQYRPNPLDDELEEQAWRDAGQCPGCGDAWHKYTPCQRDYQAEVAAMEKELRMEWLNSQ